MVALIMISLIFYCLKLPNQMRFFNKVNAIKNISGNILNDKELIELTNRTENEFYDKFKKLFQSKQEERIKLIED